MEFTDAQQKAIHYLADRYESDEPPSREGMAEACGLGVAEVTPIFALMERLGFLEVQAKPPNVALEAFLPTAPKAMERAVRMAAELDRRSGQATTRTPRKEGLSLVWKIIIGVVVLKVVMILIVASFSSRKTADTKQNAGASQVDTNPASPGSK